MSLHRIRKHNGIPRKVPYNAIYLIFHFFFLENYMPYIKERGEYKLVCLDLMLEHINIVDCKLDNYYPIILVFF
jgi:hypothetical protein